MLDAFNEVRHKLRDVLLGALPVHDFEDWLTDASWNAHSDGSEAIRLEYDKKGSRCASSEHSNE